MGDATKTLVSLSYSLPILKDINTLYTAKQNHGYAMHTRNIQKINLLEIAILDLIEQNKRLQQEVFHAHNMLPRDLRGLP